MWEISKLTDDDFSQAMHFRCKSSEIVRKDIEIMNEVRKRISHGY
jgi:hypothetical protein